MKRFFLSLVILGLAIAPLFAHGHGTVPAHTPVHYHHAYRAAAFSYGYAATYAVPVAAYPVVIPAATYVAPVATYAAPAPVCVAAAPAPAPIPAAVPVPCQETVSAPPVAVAAAPVSTYAAPVVSYAATYAAPALAAPAYAYAAPVAYAPSYSYAAYAPSYTYSSRLTAHSIFVGHQGRSRGRTPVVVHRAAAAPARVPATRSAVTVRVRSR